MNTDSAVRRAIELSLIEVARRLSVRTGREAARLTCDCWSTVAELAQGCACTEAAATLLTSALHFLEVA